MIEESEQDMVEGVFKLADSRVYSLMTPRTEITWLDIKDFADEIRRKISESPYSRFPGLPGQPRHGRRHRQGARSARPARPGERRTSS